MNALNEDQQKELAGMLGSHTFKTAKEIVLQMADGSVDGLGLDQAAIKMANEKGVRNAFRLLGKLCQPAPEHTSGGIPPLKHTLKHISTNRNA